MSENLNIFNSYDELFNNMIKINGENSLYVANAKKYMVPISNKYFLTIFNNNQSEILNFLKYINDSERTIEYPFEKKLEIDYSFMIENEQFYQMDLENSTINEIAQNLDEFKSIVSESNGEIIFVIDINYLIDFFVKIKEKSQPNHLFDLILWKLKSTVNSIFIIDKNQIVSKKENMLYIQLSKCLNVFKDINYDKEIYVYRNASDTIIESVYWNLFYSEMKQTENLQKVKSPFDNTYFDLVKINDKICFSYRVNLNKIIDKNLINLDKDPGIIIEPLDRLNISI